MTLGEYLDKKDLDIKDVLLVDENGKEIISPGTLIQYCKVIRADGNKLVIR